MKHVVVDIEGNGLQELVIDKKKRVVPECSRIHLLVIRPLNGGKARVFRNNGEEDTIAEGWAFLQSCETVVGHNIIAYDLPVLSRIYGSGDWESDMRNARVYDTLVASRTLWPDARNHPFGGNSLKAWGIKLGLHKGDYEDGWEEWNQKMEDYCVQDTLVNLGIFRSLKERKFLPKQAIAIEHRVARIISRMQQNGVSIDVPAAEELMDKLTLEHAECLAKLQESFPPEHSLRILKSYYWADEAGKLYEKKGDAPKGTKLVQSKWHKMRVDEEQFNPGSTFHIARRLKAKYGWDAPTTEIGNPSLGEDVLSELDFPEAELLLRAQMADKRLQHLTDWTTRARHSRSGRIHPQINPCGTNTSRGTHQQPNQTACPKVVTDTEGNILYGYEGRYGYEMRALWGPREGWWQVGGDASGIELRCLGHALAIYDGGAYANEVINGDVHQKAADATGMTRSGVKTPTYATLYGAGDAHLDDLCQPECSGKEFRARFEGGITGFGPLKTWCMQCASERGFIPMVDGRRAPVRSEHSALNVYLQGLGAIIMKVAMCILATKLAQKGWLWKDVAFMLWPHDEFQLEARTEEIAHETGRMLVESIVEAGKRLGIKCPLDGEYKVGRNWAHCH